MVGNGMERQKSRHRRVCMRVEGIRGEGNSFVHGQADVIKGMMEPKTCANIILLYRAWGQTLRTCLQLNNNTTFSSS